MNIRNAGRGIHAREIHGIEKLRLLPREWYAFANLELRISASENRETDVFLVMDDRILLVDLKDWHGTVKTEKGRWTHNDRVQSSPVEKIQYNARMLGPILAGYIMRRAQRHGEPLKRQPFVPYTQGVVVCTGDADYSGVNYNDRASIFHVDEFLKIEDPPERIRLLGPPNAVDRKHGLLETDGYWRNVLSEFFNVQTGLFRPQQKIYGSFVAVSEHPDYEHRRGEPDGGIYTEYDAEEKAPGRSPGLLRLWDFSHADARFQSQEGRCEIAGRESAIIQYLKDRNPEFDTAVLQSRGIDSELGPNFWEVFEKRRTLWRLRDVGSLRPGELVNATRIDLAKGLLATAKALHDIDVAHLDIGGHSVWLELPSTVKLSHLFAASYPDGQSLGADRYQFLTAAWRFPEDHLGDPADKKQRDVFLLGNAVHALLFDKPPLRSDPPEWDPDIDTDGAFADFHGWFERALSWDVKSRFASASQALAEFNTAANKRSKINEYWRLDRFRKWQDQIEVLEKYPVSRWYKRTSSRLLWQSDSPAGSLMVKVWKRSCWGDDRLETPRLLQFLEKAESLAEMQPDGVSTVREFGFTGDALVLVYDHAVGQTLEEEIAGNSSFWSDGITSLGFLKVLIECVNDLHERGIAHGDLKPENVIVMRGAEQALPRLIDVVEFESLHDGEVITGSYAPAVGGKAERDRFAVATMAKQVLGMAKIDGKTALLIGSAIQKCVEGPPENASLLPLSKAVEDALDPVSGPPSYTIAMWNAPVAKLFSDDGQYGVRVGKKGSIFIRGALQELECERQSGSFVPKRIFEIDQRRAAKISRTEIFQFNGEIVIENGSPDVSSLRFIFDQVPEEPIFESADESSLDLDVDTEGLDDDAAADDITEGVLSTQAISVDVPKLWRALIDVERELPTEGVVGADSSYRPFSKRYVIPFDLERGTFEFKRLDRVLVERQGQRQGVWREIGILDVLVSKQDLLVVDASERRGSNQSGAPIARAGDRLRLRSVLESLSQEKREAATTRILTRRSTRKDLVDYFSGSGNYEAAPRSYDAETIQRTYGLNKTQTDAFIRLLSRGPLGLVQGPPGTGKTKFIASFIHYIITAEIAANVLLASQSHEALNNAAEEVTKLFRSTGNEPSLVRLGQEDVVSSDLRSFHSESIERRYKDVFRSELTERLTLIGHNLGLNNESVSRLIFFETRIRPVVDRINLLMGKTDERSVNALFDTLTQLCEKVSLPPVDWSEVDSADIYQRILDGIVGRTDISADRCARFQRVAAMSRDWLSSVSSRQRSFDTFLAGTRRIVAGTCVGLGRAAFGVTNTKFDFTIVDEAGRCTASELAVPMQTGRRVVLVGDHLQLEPHHRPHVVKEVEVRTGIPKREIIKSDFERVFESEYGAKTGATLQEQYRMLPPIGRVVSQAFYNQTPLVHGRNKRYIPGEALPPDLNLPLIWLSSDSMKNKAYASEAPGSRSLENRLEIEAIVSLLRELDEHSAFRNWLRANERFDHPIGIICTYSAQRDALRRKLPATGLSSDIREATKVDTVDSYQGKENPIVILSLVRNNADGGSEGPTRFIKPGFLGRPNRVNVAMSRAMDCLIIVGAKERWEQGTPLSAVVDAFDREQLAGNAKTIPIEDFGGRKQRARKRTGEK